MTWLRISASFLLVSLIITPTLAAVCPDSCVCTTTRDGLHRATCSDLNELYKFTTRQKHHNINILDLSHNNITKLNHELDRLTEVVTLDLSTNGITKLNKFLHSSKKLVHLNLANNRIQQISFTQLPTSVSSIDLTNNLLKDVPSEINHLISLEHLELRGNPIDCSCENIIARNSLLAAKIFIDNVKCASPTKLKGRPWLKLDLKEICSNKYNYNELDMMMGDQPVDAIQIGEETSALKSMPLVASSDLEDGKIIQGETPVEDDDSVLYMKVGKHATSSPADDIEGSGDVESTTMPDFAVTEPVLNARLISNEEVSPAEKVYTTDDPFEGSGEGSGFVIPDYEENKESTTPIVEDFYPGPVQRFFDNDNYNSTTEFPLPEPPSIYAGGSDWHSRSESKSTDEITSTTTTTTTTTTIATPRTRDTTVSEQIRVTQASESSQKPPSPHKTGTYVCIAIIVVLLVGLIGFAIVKGQIRKRRDRRLLRQQKRDIEKASKEMVDMNKSLLGKPAVLENPIEKKVNGKYELVPTHESLQKKGENGDIGNGMKHNDQKGPVTDSPRDNNQNKSSSKDNNIPKELPTNNLEPSFDSAPDQSSSKKDNNSLSSEDIFVPLNDHDDVPKLNGNVDSEVSQPLINGDPNTDSDLLSPSREYVPVYSPDMGRVRIKMSETAKPKTPVLVNRSRSNAGDIVITPSIDSNARKSTT